MFSLQKEKIQNKIKNNDDKEGRETPDTLYSKLKFFYFFLFQMIHSNECVKKYRTEIFGE